MLDRILLAGLILIGTLFCSNASENDYKQKAIQSCFNALNDNARSMVGGPFFKDQSVRWMEWRGGSSPTDGTFRGDTLTSIASCSSSITSNQFSNAYIKGLEEGLEAVDINTTYALTSLDLSLSNPESTLNTFKRESYNLGIEVDLSADSADQAPSSSINVAIIGLGAVCVVGVGFLIARYVLKPRAA